MDDDEIASEALSLIRDERCAEHFKNADPGLYRLAVAQDAADLEEIAANIDALEGMVGSKMDLLGRVGIVRKIVQNRRAVIADESQRLKEMERQLAEELWRWTSLRERNRQWERDGLGVGEELAGLGGSAETMERESEALQGRIVDMHDELAALSADVEAANGALRAYGEYEREHPVCEPDGHPELTQTVEAVERAVQEAAEVRSGLLARAEALRAEIASQRAKLEALGKGTAERRLLAHWRRCGARVAHCLRSPFGNT